MKVFPLRPDRPQEVYIPEGDFTIVLRSTPTIQITIKWEWAIVNRAQSASFVNGDHENFSEALSIARFILRDLQKDGGS